MSGWPDDRHAQNHKSSKRRTENPQSVHSSIDTRTGISLCVLTLTLLITLLLLALSLGAVGSSVFGKNPVAAPTSGTGLQTSHDSSGFYAGPTATAAIPPFLAQTNPAPFGTPTAYIPNDPLYTSLPIINAPNGTSIFQLMGELSSYFPSSGFGAEEYPLPPGTNITGVHVLHRHGSRYPTTGSSVVAFGGKIYDLTHSGTAQWSGALSFLNEWKYELGTEILVHRGHEELFSSGVLHYYNYGALYNTSTKIVARTTTQDRMLKSAQYFMAGFFGFEYMHNVTLETQIEGIGFNNSLAGYLQCPNSYTFRSMGGSNASIIWQNIYLQNATARLRALSGDYVWTVTDSYNAQILCPYETVAFGYSSWCNLFTYEEWQGFEYSIDLQFNGNDGFASPTGRAIGIGYVQEMFARLQGHLYNLPTGATQTNYTLATKDSTFPTNQTLYFDFSHDTNIMSVITAFGLKQFAEKLPATNMPANRSLMVSHLTPFGARVVWEVIHAPHPVKAQRPQDTSSSRQSYYDNGDPTTYIHLSISQRTVPLHRSYSQCEVRDDGWCDMATFMRILNTTLASAQYEHSCFGDYAAVPYGEITDGVPIPT